MKGNTWLILIALFAVTYIVILIVGFLGNKMSDKAENALRAKRQKRMEAKNPKTGPSESLAVKMAQGGYSAAPKTYTPRFCSSCGSRLNAGDRECPKCSASVDMDVIVK